METLVVAVSGSNFEEVGGCIDSNNVLVSFASKDARDQSSSAADVQDL